MHPIAILLVGVFIVIVSVLAFRLHAFLALVLGALAVGALTPRPAAESYWVDKFKIDGSVISEFSAEIPNGKKFEYGTVFTVLRKNGVGYEAVATVRIEQYEEDEDGSAWAVAKQFGPIDDDSGGDDSEGDDSGDKAANKNMQPLEATDILIRPLDYQRAVSSAKQTVGEKVATAFGSTCTKIGILIALAAIVGKCLLDSGAADRIVRSAMKVVGEAGAPVAFIFSGFLLGIPVFFDTVFYLMIPLGKALRMRTGQNYLLYVLAIVAGGSMAHSLVPPTPGPLFVAEELGIDLGLMIVAGCVVGIFTSSAAFAYAHWINGRAELPLRESSDFSLKEIEEIAKRDESELPPLWLSVLPIVLPVIFITAWTGMAAYYKSTGEPVPEWSAIVKTLGNKNIALGIAAVIALGTLIWQKRTSLKELAEPIQGALASGGVIILITAGGGAFGGMLQQTGVASLIGQLGKPSTVVVILLAFLITTAIRTAQGSATVAMITAVGVLAGFATPGSLDCHPVYLALAIGCGSKPVAWMNDSGFWVICKMSGMTEAEGLRFVTPMSVLMGIVGLTITIIGALLLPMA